MNERIGNLLNQMAALEEELRVELQQHEAGLLFNIKGKRIEFEQSIKETHRRLKTGFFHWLVTYRPQNLITGPIIYGMIVPLVILDFFVTVYQADVLPDLPGGEGPSQRLHRVRPAATRIPQFHREVPLHLLCVWKWADCLCGRDRGAHRAVLLPDQARPQDPRHPLGAMQTFWTMGKRMTMKPSLKGFVLRLPSTTEPDCFIFPFSFTVATAMIVGGRILNAVQGLLPDSRRAA